MLKIYPFEACTPPTELAAEVASLPYDVISSTEARSLADGKPYSFLRVVRAEVDLLPETSPYADEVYSRAAENLDSLIEQGVLQTQTPGIYLYRQVHEDHEQTGIVCCYDVEQYRSGLIKKHELTRPDKEDDRVRHLSVCSAHAEPVLLAINDDESVSELMRSDCESEPIFQFTASDGVSHAAWRVATPQQYVSAFAKLDAAYIADGHHRTAAAERVAGQRQAANPQHTGDEEYNRVMSVMFPASQLRILAYNRLVKDLNGLSLDEFWQRLAAVGQLEATDQPTPDERGQVCVYAGSEQGWMRLTFSDASLHAEEVIETLDVALLQSQILTPVLGVTDPRVDHRIEFVGGSRGTAELVERIDSGQAAVAFSMFPTSLKQLMEVSDQGKVMPPKSTWFEPKLRSGLFVHKFEP